ncbi:MAG: hypothetical protein KME07_00800 [Pegethrix bostrychoides GSE-TBD4-15B]|jgi:hypothetical protein|uniref:Bacterial Ig-like domain-containing protein n=1 Tax=Pegethrix bostrychoides GSE-TBD4-15B TaxID=2839662 RepID=A0A951P7E1_9CYAN|nr:hypothetical protein [Pegethrix bostrychoides GSE-TBD4-15B]
MNLQNARIFAAAVCLVLGMAAPGLSQTSPTTQQVSPATAAPEIDSFSVEPIAQLTPGSELLFTLQGTPSAQATFTISDIASNLTMREVEPGVYEGRYTIRSSDPISESTIIRANLSQGSQISSARLQNSLTSSTASAAAPTATAPTAAAPTAAIPLEILSPADSTKIGDNVEVTGRSVPQTTINVKVQANNSLGGVIGINRDVFDRDIQTDAEGNFRFDFQPPLGISGTRYEMSLTTANGGQTQQETLTLIQQ